MLDTTRYAPARFPSDQSAMQHLYEVIPDPVVVVDSDWAPGYRNRAAMALSAADLATVIRAALIGSRRVRLEDGRRFLVTTTRAGDEHWLHFRDVTAETTGFDVSPDSAARFRQELESAKIGVLVFDRAGRIVEVSDAACEAMKYSRGEITAMAITDLLPATELARSPLRWSQLEAGELVRRFVPFVRKDGTTLLGVVNAHRRADGLFQAVIHDESERIKANAERDELMQQLASRELHLRTILDSEPECVKLVAPNGTLLEMNPAGLAMIEAPNADAVLGQSVLHLIHPDHRRAFAETHRAALRGERSDLEFEIIGLQGTRRWVASTIVPLRATDGTIKAALSITRDVTERRRADAETKRLHDQLLQAQRMEAVGRLAGGIAHDFNNLITVIGSYADLLLEEHGGDARIAADVRQIRDAGTRAAHLTRQLLAFSRKQILRPTTLDVNAVVRGIVPMITRLLGEDITIDLRLGAEPMHVMCDPGQLEQVLVNLAVNARDAMPTGGELTIATAFSELDATHVAGRPHLPPGRYVLLSVTDTGTGMNGETRARIFEPFFTTKPEGEGTGLGLASVYGIVQQSDGHISVHSEEGRGTTFETYLPVAAATLAGLTAPAARGSQTLGSETILLVEDDAAVRQLAHRVLSEQGYVVLEATNGREGLEVEARCAQTIHLALTDVVMPQMSGREFGEAFARARPAARVLYMSGYTDDEIIRRGLMERDWPFLEKPFTAEQLARAVREELDTVR